MHTILQVNILLFGNYRRKSGVKTNNSNHLTNKPLIIVFFIISSCAESEELPFRTTKDLDIALIVESITYEFGKAFWKYIKEAKYSHINKSTQNAPVLSFHITDNE